VTAEDFKNSFLRIMVSSETNGAYLAGLIKNGKDYIENGNDNVGIEVIDEWTLKITTESPTPFFLEVLTFAGFVPVHAFVQDNTTVDWAKDPDKHITNGPFMFETYEKGKYISLVKNPYYWDRDQVTLTQVDFQFRTEYSDMISMFTSNDIDGVYEVTADELRVLPDSEAVTHSDILGSTAYIAFNHSDEIFSDMRLRQAIALSLDRTRIVEDVLFGAGIASQYFVPFNYVIDGTQFREYTILNPEQNLTKARALIADLKSEGHDLSQPIDIYYTMNGPDSKTADYIADLLNVKLGLKTQAKGLTWEELYQTTMANEYQMVILGWVADYPHPLSFLGTFGEKGVLSKMTDWQDTSYDLMADAFFQNSHSQNTLEHLRSMEDIIINGYHIVPLYYRKGLSIVDNNLKGWYRNQSALFIFKNAYFEE
jgi:oligopeptide transport system substrate-binding protein